MQNHYQAAAFPASNPPHRIPPAVSEHLQERLLAIPFADFADLIARLLARMGYQDVQGMGAMHEKGRNLHGGFDLTAQVQTGVTRSLLLVQVKQYRRPMPRSFVDELRGAMVRLGAQQGLIVSTDAFSPAARDAAQAGQHSLPLRLVGGSELVRLLLEHEVVPEPVYEEKERAFARTVPVHEPRKQDNAPAPAMPQGRDSVGAASKPQGRRVIITVRLAPDRMAGNEGPPSRPFSPTR